MTADFTRRSKLAPFRAPLIAGGGTALAFATVIGAIALFGQDEFDTPFARGAFDPVEAPGVNVADLRPGEGEEGEDQIIAFSTPEDLEAEPSLDGVGEGFTPPPEPAAVDAPSTGSDPEAAERALAEAASNPDALPAAPIAGLSEAGPGGRLPVIGASGERVSRAYARPFHGDPTAPTVAIVIGGLGLNAAVTERAIAELPPETTLSFAAYADDLQGWIDRARAAGHEVLIEAPMEPFDYPNNDPGPHTLLADGQPAENDRRLNWVLARAEGYFGVTNYLGARFSASGEALTHTLETLESRGVAFLHDGAGRRSTIAQSAQTAGVEWAIADRVLDEDPSPRAIDERLLALEALALQNGQSIGSGFAYPATIDQVLDWTANLEAGGYQLAPVSAVMARRRVEARLVEAASGGEGDHGPAETH